MSLHQTQKANKTQPANLSASSEITSDKAFQFKNGSNLSAFQDRLQKLANNRKAVFKETPVSSVNRTLQMAGHSGVMIFSKDGTRLCKRVEENEALEFIKVMYQQKRSEDEEIRKNAQSAFPEIYNVLSGPKIATGIEGFENNSSWFSKHKSGDWYVVMENLGGKDISIFDFKIGTTTAHAEELQKNYHKSPSEAKKKVDKMATIDQTSETANYGLRDSDALRNEWKKAFSRWRGNYEESLQNIEARVKKLPGNKYPVNAQVFDNLAAIRHYIKTSDTVYVASSLILKAHKDNPKEDRLVLIDLAHPVTKTMAGFEKIKEGMLLGIQNLEFVLNGQQKINLDEYRDL